MLGKSLSCSFYLINFFPEFPTPYLHFSSPYEKGWAKMMCKVVFRVHNPPSSQIAGLLSNVPIKTQSLSLFTGSGSDRQHEH